MDNARPANEEGWLLKIIVAWLSSTLITTAGIAAAWVIAFWVELFGPTYDEVVLLWLLVGPFFSWPVIGLFQLAIFGSKIRGKLRWVLLTGLAWILTFVILIRIFPSLFAGGGRSLTMHPALLACITGILIGSAFGLLQWSVLRRTVVQAGSWILTWIVAWVLSLLLLQYLSQLPLPLQDPQKLQFLVLAGALMIGMVAGGGYTWMFQPSVRKIPILAGLMAIPLIFALGLAVPLTTTYSQQSRLMRPAHGLANVLDISFSPDGSMLGAVTNVATAESENRGLAIWDVATGKEIASLETSADRLTLLPGGKQIVTAGPLHNPVAIWDIASGEQVSTISERANDIAVSGDGNLLAIATGNYREAALVLWDLRAGKEVKRLRTTLAVYHVAFSPNGKFLALGLGHLGRNQVRILDIEHSSPRLIVPDLPGGVVSPVFSPDGSRVLFGTGRTVQVWSIDRQRRVALLSVGGNVGSLALSPDGRVIAVARGQLERDKSIYLYDLATGQLLETLMGHIQAVTSLAFSPNGQYLASASWDGTVRLWEILSED